MRDEVVLAIDLGKTSCRARITGGVGGDDSADVIAETRGAGAPGLADHNGAELSFASIVGALEGVAPALQSQITTVGIGAAGVEAGRAAARELAALVHQQLAAPVAIINDALAAHAGAFEGGPGAILIAGTGAVVFVVTESGTLTQIDGWGPWLGDDGSGQWIGRHGLQAVTRAHDHRGPATALTADAAALAGALERLPRWVSETGAPARRLGMFAPAVIARAEEGDPVATEIVTAAATQLAATCAASGSTTVCVTGGLSTQPYFASKITDALAAAGMRQLPANGDALDGSALIALRHDLAYEERIIRG